MNKRLVLTLPALLGLSLATGVCGRTRAASVAAPVDDGGPQIRIGIAEVRLTHDRHGTEIPAAIESSRLATLSSRLAASIVALNAREGDPVKAGALLVRLEDTALKAALSAAEASDQAAARDLSRAQTLFAKDAATRSEVENAETAATRTRSSVIAAREALCFASIRAPFSGRVLRKLANVGDIVNPGQALIEIEGAGGLEVVASIEGATRGRLLVGEKVEVRIDGIATPLAATIHDLAPSADPSTHRFTLRADIVATEGVRSGLFARVLLSSPGDEARILVPTAALEQRGSLTGVYVVRGGRAWLRWIAPGDRSGDALEVRAGLEAGERVALDPSRLHDGAPVVEIRQ